MSDINKHWFVQAFNDFKRGVINYYELVDMVLRREASAPHKETDFEPVACRSCHGGRKTVKKIVLGVWGACPQRCDSGIVWIKKETTPHEK